jgi:hypothetical protein
MASHPDNYDQYVELTRLLEKHYRDVKADLSSVARIAALEEVKRIAATNEAELQRLFEEAGRSRPRGVAIPRLQITSAAKAVAALVVALAIVVTVAFTGVPGLFRGRSEGADGAAERTVAAATTGEASPEPAEIRHEPLHEVAVARYDSLFTRRDPAFRELIDRVANETRSPADTVPEAVLTAWEGKSDSADEGEIVHVAALQAALRDISSSETPAINGRIDRQNCESDPTCREVLRRWRSDRTRQTGLRLLPAVSDAGTPRADALRDVEKLFVYDRLSGPRS